MKIYLLLFSFFLCLNLGKPLVYAESLTDCQNRPIFIPAGEIRLGREDAIFPDEKLSEKKLVPSFFLSQFEITVGAFFSFVQSKNDSSFYDLLAEEAEKTPCKPARRMNWFQADQYCRSLGGRLPTEVEWEYAASVDTQNPLNKYPWNSGEQFPPDFWEEETDEERDKTRFLFSEILEVQHSFAGFNKLYGMMGNLWEWTGDWYSPNYSQERQEWEKVIRGGSYQNIQQPDLMRPTVRNLAKPEQYFYQVGFRCAWSGKPQLWGN